LSSTATPKIVSILIPDFAEVEQAAFSPANLVPGIAVSDDKLLQGRLFACTDAARYYNVLLRYRLGTNFMQIPINTPYTTRVRNYHRDGQMSVNGNAGALQNYEKPETVEPEELTHNATFLPQNVLSSAVARHTVTPSADDYIQPGVFWRNVLSPAERARVVSRMVESLGHVKRPIAARVVAWLKLGDEQWGKLVEEGLVVKARV
jgi:catalase